MADSFTKESSVDPSLGLAPRSLPREAILSTVPGSSLSASKKIVNVVPITSNSVGPSQTLQFLLPQRNFAKANSVYLKFRFQATGGSSSQQRWAFSGGMQSAGSLFNNISLQAGGVILESMQNYHVWHNNVIEWMHSGSDLMKIESLCSGSRLAENLATGGTVAIKFTADSDTLTTIPRSAYTVQGFEDVDTVIQPGMILCAAGVYIAYVVSVSSAGAITLNASTALVKNAFYELHTLPVYPSQVFAGYSDDSTVTASNYSKMAQNMYDLGNSTGTTPQGFNGTQRSLMQFGRVAAANYTYDMVFSIPLYLGFFNPKESQLIPLEFINGGVLLTLQTNPVTKAFWSELTPDGTNGFTSYTLTDFELCYTEIAPSPDFMMDVRNDLGNKKFIKIETQSYQNFLLSAQNGNTRQMFNANLSSLSCLLFGRIAGLDAWTTSKMFQWVGHDGNNQIRYEIYFDNVLMFNSANQLNSVAVAVRQLQEALGSSIGDYVCTPASSGRGLPVRVGSSPVDNANINYNTYCGGHALMGLSTRVFSSNSTSMDGTPVGTITINFFNQDGEANTNLWYFYLVYDYIYTIDATGSVEKVQ